MTYQCVTCKTTYEQEENVCSKCGGFSIQPVVRDRINSRFVTPNNRTCRKCGVKHDGDILIKQNKASALIYIAGVSLIIVTPIAIWGLLHLMLEPGKSLKVPIAIFFSGVIPFSICIWIGNKLKQIGEFKCTKCQTVNQFKIP